MGVAEAELDRFVGEATALAPPGLVHQAPRGTVRRQVLEGLFLALARSDARRATLHDEADPRTTTELLAGWERVWGLPGPCATLATSLILRRYALTGKVVAVGGQSLPYLLELAAALGYEVELEEHLPFQAGTGEAGARVYGLPWTHVVTVHAPEASPTFFSAGASGAGDPLVDWTNEPLECHLDGVKPAHARFLYVFDLPPTPGYGPWAEVAAGTAGAVAVSPPILFQET